jgi:hypothetical protein
MVKWSLKDFNNPAMDIMEYLDWFNKDGKGTKYETYTQEMQKNLELIMAHK